MTRNRTANLFSTITQPWRQLGAILWIHVIIHIFITIHPKSAIFNAHKLQAICQHTGLSISGLYQIGARARASKFKIAQNLNLNNGEHVSGHFEHFKIFRPYMSARAEKVNIQIFCMIWIPLTIIDNFHSFQSLLTFHKAVSVRQSSKSARAAMGNIMQKWAKTCHFWNRNSSSELSTSPNFHIMVGKSMSWKYNFIPPWLVQSETKSSYWHQNYKKMYFFDDVIFSPRFWYVVAETILYKKYDIFIFFMTSS